MKSKQVRFWLLVVLLLASGALIHAWERAGEAHIERRALKDFPTHLGGWRQVGVDVRFNAETEAILRAHDYVLRDFTNDEGRVASLYVGYYDTQRAGALYHSPLNCLPGSGWVLSEPATMQITPEGGGAPFEANRYIIQHGDSKQFLVYWYQGRGRATASEYWDKVYTVLDSVRRRRSDGAMVRVLVPVRKSDDDAHALAQDFASRAAPHLRDYVPE
jgi:EpsI family protein